MDKKRPEAQFLKELNSYIKKMDRRIKITEKNKSNNALRHLELARGKKEDTLRMIKYVEYLLSDNVSDDEYDNTLIERLKEVFEIIEWSKNLEQLVLTQHEELKFIQGEFKVISNHWYFMNLEEEEEEDKNKEDWLGQPEKKSGPAPRSLKEIMYLTSRGECPKCGSKTRMIQGPHSIFFGCTKYPETGCKGILRPDKEDLEYFCFFQDHFEYQEMQNEMLIDSMEAFPDWDPDLEDLDDYLDSHGYLKYQSVMN